MYITVYDPLCDSDFDGNQISDTSSGSEVDGKIVASQKSLTYHLSAELGNSGKSFGSRKATSTECLSTKANQPCRSCT